MKNLVRGGAVTLCLGLFVIIFYAQTTKIDLANTITVDPKVTLENSVSENRLINITDSNDIVEPAAPVSDDEKDKKLVKKTVAVTAAGAGASRGAFSATAYCFSGRTAMGHGVRRGLIAADPRVLKMGSRVYINAGQWSGTYLVSDTGGAIKGKRIDIWVPSCGEARRFGRRTVTIASAQ